MHGHSCHPIHSHTHTVSRSSSDVQQKRLQGCRRPLPRGDRQQASQISQGYNQKKGYNPSDFEKEKGAVQSARQVHLGDWFWCGVDDGSSCKDSSYVALAPYGRKRLVNQCLGACAAGSLSLLGQGPPSPGCLFFLLHIGRRTTDCECM